MRRLGILQCLGGNHLAQRTFDSMQHKVLKKTQSKQCTVISDMSWIVLEL